MHMYRCDACIGITYECTCMCTHVCMYDFRVSTVYVIFGFRFELGTAKSEEHAKWMEILPRSLPNHAGHSRR